MAWQHLLFGTAVCLTACTAAAGSVAVTGVDAAAAKNIVLMLEPTGEAEPWRLDNSSIRETAAWALRPYGYYSPSIDVTRDGKKLSLRVDPGERTVLTDSAVEITGAAKNDPDFVKLLAAVPKAGTPLSHAAYENFKKSLNTLTLQKGYFDARFAVSRLEVEQKRAKARWVIRFESGERYRVGETVFAGSQIDPERLATLAPYKAGDYFSATAVAELSRRLSQTGWFELVSAAPDFEKGTPDALPVVVSLVPRKKNVVETGLGVSSDTGVTGTVSWTRPWINRRGYSLTAETSVSTAEQSFEASLKIPVKENPLEQYYLVSAGYKHTDLNDTASSAFTLSLSRYWQTASGWQRVALVKASQDHFTQGGVTQTTQLIYPGLSLTRIRQRGDTSPSWGDSQKYSIDVSSGAWASDVDFVILRLDNTWLRTFKVRHRVIGRISLGAVFADDIDAVPPDLRFFAGGDKSIRGFDYKGVSPEDGRGRLIGGSKLATASLEYQYNVTGRWWGAAFFDAGDAVRSMDDFTVHKGAGAGIRWDSPVGPVKFDLAWPINDASERGLHFYIGLGAQW